MRVCNVCLEEKDLENFHNCKSFPLGKVYTCKPCARSKSKAWGASNKDAKAKQGKKHYQENREAYLERAKNSGWAKENTERVRELARLRYQADKEKHISKLATRRAKRLKATPSWANQDRINLIYALCNKISKQTGKPHHVDHIIPLQGEFVCLWASCRK